MKSIKWTKKVFWIVGTMYILSFFVMMMLVPLGIKGLIIDIVVTAFIVGGAIVYPILFAQFCVLGKYNLIGLWRE